MHGRQSGPWQVGRSGDTAVAGDWQEHRAIHASIGRDGWLQHANGDGPQQGGTTSAGTRYGSAADAASRNGGLPIPHRVGRERQPFGQGAGVQHAMDGAGKSRGAVSPYGASWSNFDTLHFLDGKARRVESGTFPLVDGLPRGVVPSCDISVAYAQATAEGRVMRLKGYGNAIVPQVAAEFIQAYMEVAA
jgi:hypothetical protein